MKMIYNTRFVRRCKYLASEHISKADQEFKGSTCLSYLKFPTLGNVDRRNSTCIRLLQVIHHVDNLLTRNLVSSNKSVTSKDMCLELGSNGV